VRYLEGSAPRGVTARARIAQPGTRGALPRWQCTPPTAIGNTFFWRGALAPEGWRFQCLLAKSWKNEEGAEDN